MLTFPTLICVPRRHTESPHTVIIFPCLLAAAAANAAGVGTATVNNDVWDAVKGADVVYTDVWASMGQKEEAEKRKRVFKDFQVSGADDVLTVTC